jgi:sugar lactone lactonase YvrE
MKSIESRRRYIGLTAASLVLVIATTWSLQAQSGTGYSFSSFAGAAPGTINGSGLTVRFDEPQAVAVDAAGNSYVAQFRNGVVRKVSAGGVVSTFFTIAPARDGGGFIRSDIAVDPAGIVYVSGFQGIDRISPAGVLLGSVPGSVGSTQVLDHVTGLDVDGSGNIYVADNLDCTLKRVTPDNTVTTLVGHAQFFHICGNPVDGPVSQARLWPNDVAVAPDGTLFFTDVSRTVRVFSTSGVVSTLAGSFNQSGTADGTGSAARFTGPSHIAISAAGDLYVTDGNAIRKVTQAGVVTTVAGSATAGSADGTGAAAAFKAPVGIAVDSSGSLRVADTGNGTIRLVSPSGTTTTLAGLPYANAPPALNAAEGVATNGTGDVYVADTANHAIVRITPPGPGVVVAGSAGTPGSADGAGSAARFLSPAAVAVADDRTVYVADTGNHTIRRIGPDGTVTTLAGVPGVSGSSDGPLQDARFNAPAGIVLANGILYVADTGNHTVRAVHAVGGVTTVAGMAGTTGSADGKAGAARFNQPRGLAVDAAGAILVADTGNHTIRVVTSDGVVTTRAGLAGTPGAADGAPGAARFNAPRGVTAGAAGTLFVADSGNHTIRQIAADGTVTTIGGAPGAAGFVNGGGDVTRFSTPSAIAALADGTLYIADAGTGTIRQGLFGTEQPAAITGQPANQTVLQGRTAQFSVGATGNPAVRYQWQMAPASNPGSFQDVADTAPFSGARTATLTITAAPGSLNGARFRCLVSNAATPVISNTAILTVYALTFSPASLSFVAKKASPSSDLGTVTPPQSVTVAYGGPGTTQWTATANQPWIRVTGGSGTNGGAFTVSIVNPDNVTGGTLTGSVTVTDAALQLTSVLPVTLTLVMSTTSAPPIGAFDTPANNSSGLQGSVAVTGWALDDIGVDHVEIWRDAVPGETTPVYGGSGPGNGKIYIANPTFVSGARPDVAKSFGGLPLSNRAGWGYLMLTYGLWNQGNGTYKLYAFAFDGDGQSTTLGTKTITVSNATATKPFGSIDTPAQGGTATGTVQNFGWALTPGPSCTIANPNVQVSIDSGALTPVVYGDARSDVAAAFPGYTNAAAAGGHYTLDTTTLTDGVHTIGWVVTDSCGRADGIGSRFFTVVNGTAQTTGLSASMKAAPRELVPRSFSDGGWSLSRMEGPGEAVRVATGGERVIHIAEGERVALQLPGEATYVASGLLIGSSFDAAAGKFYWQPAPGFLGAYDLEFTAGSRTERVRAVVGPPIRMVIDTPRAGNVLSASGFTLAGWAVDLASLDGAGVDTLHVWAYPVGGGAPVFVGVAEPGGKRPDVASLYGAAFAAAGFTLRGTLAPGTYDLVVYAHSAATHAFEAAETTRVIVR